MRVAPLDGMKRALAMLGLLALGGCGSIANLATGPQIYGGVRHDSVYVGGSSCLPIRWTCDIPFSAVLDTGLLPVTLTFEGIRCATGWPPKEVLMFESDSNISTSRSRR